MTVDKPAPGEFAYLQRLPAGEIRRVTDPLMALDSQPGPLTPAEQTAKRMLIRQLCGIYDRYSGKGGGDEHGQATGPGGNTGEPGQGSRSQTGNQYAETAAPGANR